MCLSSEICRKVKMWSIKLQLGRKPAWFSRILSSRMFHNRQRIILTICLDAIHTKLTLLCFSHQDLSPFSKIGKTNDSHWSLGFSSLLQIDPMSFVHFDANTSPLSLKKKGDSSSSPSTLCHSRQPISLLTFTSGGRPRSICSCPLVGISRRPTVGCEPTKLLPEVSWPAAQSMSRRIS